MKRTTKHVALDVHQATTVASVREESGRVIARTILPTEDGPIVEFFRGMRGAIHVAFEEGTQAQWLHDLVAPLVQRVVVCDRRGEARRGNKGDQVDAARSGKARELLWNAWRIHRSPPFLSKQKEQERGSEEDETRHYPDACDEDTSEELFRRYLELFPAGPGSSADNYAERARLDHPQLADQNNPQHGEYECHSEETFGCRLSGVHCFVPCPSYIISPMSQRHAPVRKSTREPSPTATTAAGGADGGFSKTSLSDIASKVPPNTHTPPAMILRNLLTDRTQRGGS